MNTTEPIYIRAPRYVYCVQEPAHPGDGRHLLRFWCLADYEQYRQEHAACVSTPVDRDLAARFFVDFPLGARGEHQKVRLAK